MRSKNESLALHKFSYRNCEKLCAELCEKKIEMQWTTKYIFKQKAIDKRLDNKQVMKWAIDGEIARATAVQQNYYEVCEVSRDCICIHPKMSNETLTFIWTTASSSSQQQTWRRKNGTKKKSAKRTHCNFDIKGFYGFILSPLRVLSASLSHFCSFSFVTCFLHVYACPRNVTAI